eukprot:3295421-Prymnesium_polylepis.1
MATAEAAEAARNASREPRRTRGGAIANGTESERGQPELQPAGRPAFELRFGIRSPPPVA